MNHPSRLLLSMASCCVWLGSAGTLSAQVPLPPIEPPGIEPIEPPLPIEPPPVEPPLSVEPAPPEDLAPPVEAPPPSDDDRPPAADQDEDEDSNSRLSFKATVGVGVRAELIFDPDSDDTEGSPTYTLNHNLRPYLSGQVHRYVKFEANLDSSEADIVVLDAIVKLEFNDYFNLWAGRFLPPSDRANLSGPYFQNAWTYPGNVNAYPSVYAGRDDGVAIWGQINGGQFKWQVGAFDMGGGTADPRLAGRITLNLLDPEPGYYNSSTYYGEKDVLAISGVLQYKSAPDGADDSAEDAIWNVDALFEDSFRGAGTLDIEGAFYGFGGADQGTSFFALASFLIEPKLGMGQLQPMFRVQRAAWGDGDTFTAFGTPFTAPEGVDATLLTLDAGLHYIISGHNARLAATFSHTAFDLGSATDAVTESVFILGGQVQAF